VEDGPNGWVRASRVVERLVLEIFGLLVLAWMTCRLLGDVPGLSGNGLWWCV